MKKISKKSYKDKFVKDYQNNAPMSVVREIFVPYSKIHKRIDETWDYKGVNTKEYTHCFHIYPAMMIPQIARRLLEEYGSKAKLLFDPYCGTGTSLVEANLKGINAIGTDINELARLIAKVKTTRLNINELKKYIDQFNDFIFHQLFSNEINFVIDIPNVTNIDYWFSKSAQRKLGIVLYFINQISNRDIADFFKVAFSETVRDSSFTKLNEFKLVKEKKLDGRIDPDVYSIMNSKLQRNFSGLKEFLSEIDDNVFTRVYGFNTVFDIPISVVKPNSIDIVLTSPPYGDSKTTVAYGQFSRFSSEWLSLKNANEVDKLSMGGKIYKELIDFDYPILNDTIKMIKNKDEKRAFDVFSFYKDYEMSIKNISKIVKEGGFVCYVVGNRTVKGIQIPNDEITKEMFERNGFEYIETIVRNIPSKRMPLKNSPTNVTGETAETMKKEFIVILQKK